MIQISVQITIGSSINLLDRYVVAWSFLNRSKTYVFDASGGVIQETIFLEDGEAIPDSLSVDITVDFKPESNIPGYRFSKKILRNADVYSDLFEISQIERVVLCFDLPWNWVGQYANDYLFVKWNYSQIDRPLHTGLFLINSNEFSNFIMKEFYLLQDAESSGASGDINYEITGRLHGWAVEKFQTYFSLKNAKIIALRPEFRDSPSRFLLRVVS